MTRIRKRNPVRSGPPRLGAALVALWYLLVYTHLPTLALAHFAPPASPCACCCAAADRGCCLAAGGTRAGHSLPDDSPGCHGSGSSAGKVCLLAGGCGDELPAAPQADARTWPHLAAVAFTLQPLLQAADWGFGTSPPSFSHISIPPDKIPKHLS